MRNWPDINGILCQIFLLPFCPTFNLPFTLYHCGSLPLHSFLLLPSHYLLSFRFFHFLFPIFLAVFFFNHLPLPQLHLWLNAYATVVCATDHVFVLYQWKLFGATVLLGIKKGVCLRQTLLALKRSFLAPLALDSRFALAALSANNTKPSLWQRLMQPLLTGFFIVSFP